MKRGAERAIGVTGGAKREEVAMRGKKVKWGGDESRAAEIGTWLGGEMRVDRRREVERRIRGMEGETQEEKAIRGTHGGGKRL